MSVSPGLLCAVLGHSSSALYTPYDLDIYVSDEDMTLRPEVQTLDDLVAAFDRCHAQYCACGIPLGPSVWRVNLPLGQDSDAALAWCVPAEEHLLDGSTLLRTGCLSDLPSKTIHLLLGTRWPLEPKATELTSGLRRLGGDLCRVAGSSARSLPDTPSFPEIVGTAGCYYVERFDWIMEHFGGEDLSEHTRIPVIRRPPGFGTTTFLSAFASYFGDTVDKGLFPCLRVWDDGTPSPLLVWHLDFADLRLEGSMSDEELHAECLRFMYAAAEQFYAQNASLADFDRDNTPYGNVKVLACKLGRKVFLAIDNYTAPFLDLEPISHRDTNGAFYRIERAINLFIFSFLFVGTGTGLFPRGLITGNMLPDEESGPVLPFDDGGFFSKETRDLTRDPDAAHIIGFTRGDVEELVRAFLGVADDGVAEVAARLVPRHAEAEVEATYAARAVIEVLRAAAAAAGATERERGDELQLRVEVLRGGESDGEAP
ncbi:hypothetical protein AURDEDRAFT_159198 [Auricularia subglabra TFB-10046 SS5]|nr:hypothetical protein AURDEDRAFT_159198 [Auricularia subglabra TFB-10046 SS5]